MQKPSAPVYPHVSTVNLAGLSTTPPLSPGPNTLMLLVHSDDNVDLKRRPQDLGADEGHHDDVPPHLDRRVGVLRGVVVWLGGEGPDERRRGRAARCQARRRAPGVG